MNKICYAMVKLRIIVTVTEINWKTNFLQTIWNKNKQWSNDQQVYERNDSNITRIGKYSIFR